jgi:hypothetical protein
MRRDTGVTAMNDEVVVTVRQRMMMRHGSLLLLTLLTMAACQSHPSGLKPGDTDSSGDPVISDAQGRAVQIGEDADTAFASLGGQASSGSNGQQAVPPLSYDYPIAGTGDPNDVMDGHTVWWQLCVKKGVVVSKQRGTMGEIPTLCPGATS